MKLVEVDERAAAEVLEAALWYEARQEGVGVRFTNAVEGAIEALTTRRLRPLEGYASRGVKVLDVGKPWPYRIVVIERPNIIRVVAVHHHHRRPGYWSDRVSD
jgi:hypothetical protein